MLRSSVAFYVHQRRQEGCFTQPVALFCATRVFAVSLFLILGIASATAQSRSIYRHIINRSVPQAQVDTRIVRLPVVDGQDIRFKHLPATGGLSQTRAEKIVQDDQGFLWFGTQYGLDRYDGYEFKVFAHDPNNPDSLSGVYVYSLFKDRSGTLWVGTDQFLDKFDRATETFSHYHLDARNPKIIDIIEDSAGILWLSTPIGLYRLNPRTGEITGYHHDQHDPASLNSSDVKSAGEDRRGSFWVANGEGLDNFDRATGKVTLHIPLQVSMREFSFHEDRHGVFWIIYATGNGLAVFDRKTNRLTRYSFYHHEPTGGTLTGVLALLEDHDGTMWFATMGAGLLKLDRDHDRFIRYRHDPRNPESLAEDRVIGLCEDRQGNIWIGLHGMVPNFFGKHLATFESIRLDPSNPDGLGENLVDAIYEDRLGTLWIGADGGLSRINRKSGQRSFYQPAGSGVATDVLAILEDHTGKLWLGTLGHGLVRLDLKSGKFKRYRHDPTDPYSLSNDSVMRVFIDHTGTMWLATWDGLDRFDPVTERFTTYKRDPLTINESYGTIAEDKNGMLWLSPRLVRFDPSTSQFKVFSHDPQNLSTLSSNTVYSVLVDRSGTIWAGTQDGLAAFNPKTETFTTYYEQDGLAGNAVSCILEDSRGDLWTSTNKGLSDFNPRTKTFKNYSTADGLPGDDLTGWGACFRSPAGEMFFGGYGGATAFNPDRVSDETYVPPVVFTDFRLKGSAVKIGDHSPLRVSITATRGFTLSHDQNMFSLKFAALGFLSPGTTRYRYKLGGLDSEWHEAGSEQRVVSYTTLPARVYELQVQAAVSRGPWSEPGARLRIEILPAWWSTWWFRVAYGAFIVLIAFAAYSYRMREMARRFDLRLEERINERTRIARELHDTLLQSFQGLMLRFQTVQEMLPARPMDAKKAFEGALERADQALGESRDAITDIRTSTLASHDLAKSMTALFAGLNREVAEGNGGPATFRVLVEGAPRAVRPILQDEIYRIARESLRNAFRHAQARNIETEITYGESLRLRFRDDGKGIDPSVVERGGRSGHWGLPGMRERAAQIGAQLQVWSELGAGTEVELNIPGSVAYEGSATRTGFHFFRKRTKQNREHRS
jgi:ligand-binding sensor domain-containing protein/signal transduction histidine kinase